LVPSRGRILVVSPWSQLWSLAPGAGVSDESHTLAGLIDRGYEIHMLVPRSADLMAPHTGLCVHTFPNVLSIPAWIPAPLRRLWLLPAFWSVASAAARRLALEVRPAIVLGFSHYGARPAHVAARAVDVPSVLKLFGVMHAMRLEWTLPRYMYHNLEGVLAFRVPMTHFIILNDGTLGRTVARRWGVTLDRVTYLPNGVDLEWADIETDRAVTRREHGATDDTMVYVSLSRLVQSKRVDRIVDAVATATTLTSKPLQLWVVGDGPLRAKLEARCRRRGIAHRFLGGVQRERVPHVLAAADALVSTSVLTNMSIPTCEAMLVGTPVIALDVAGTSEVVQDMVTGLLVPEESPEVLALALARLADDADLRARLGDNARAFAMQHFVGWEERVGAEITTLERLIRESKAAPTTSAMTPPSYPTGA
jgi:glycosyltransferase involved in cell wall biosynthesis